MNSQGLFFGISFAVTLLATSCSENQRPGTQIKIDSSSADFSFALPRTISQARSVNRGNLDLIISIDGVPIDVSWNGDDIWTARTTIEQGRNVSMSIEWIELFQLSTPLVLAIWQDRMTISSDLNIQISDSDYITSNQVIGDFDDLNFDVDQDGFSNLSERKAESNPLDPESTPDSIPSVDVIVPVSTFRSPNIDGNYSAEDYETQNAQFRDTSGRLLQIDNLMLDEGQGTAGVLPSRGNGGTEMRWFTIHDNSNLYISVLGEDVQLSNPVADSLDPWQDDNINIFLDTDNSAGDIYDGINDFHIMIPLLDFSEQANKSDVSGSRILVSERSAPLALSQIEFATCGSCGTSGQHLWEVKIPFNAVGLQKDSVFGIDVQLDIDHDGGDRDVKWGWHHPPGFDSTWEVPSRMAKGYIQ